jgi:hypothetical protein
MRKTILAIPHSITNIYKVMNGKIYVWCTHCHQGHGLWFALTPPKHITTVFNAILLAIPTGKIYVRLLLIHLATINSKGLILLNFPHLQFLKQ